IELDVNTFNVKNAKLIHEVFANG
mgnify:CR=1